MSGLLHRDSEIQKLSKIFNKMDKSKDGYICVHEIEEVMNELRGEFTSIIGHDPNWKQILESLDTNNDGALDFNEFISAATNRVILLNEENLKKAFSILDTNNDGRVSAKELQERFAQAEYAADYSNLKFDDSFFDKLLAECDSNGDGYIDFNEFKTTMTSMLEKEKQNSPQVWLLQ